MAEIRKRSKWDRAGDRRRRPRTPAPTTGWLIRELSQMTETTVRTLRNYVAAGLITPLELRGTSTRYARRELLRLLAALRARKETKLTLAAIKHKLDAFAEDDLEAWLRNGPLPPLAAAALGIPPVPPQAVALMAERPLERWSAQVQTWQRIELLPGLLLMLGPNPSPAVVSAAGAICVQYLG
jgi:DNA-binding transcriptional MerR regulator